MSSNTGVFLFRYYARIIFNYLFNWICAAAEKVNSGAYWDKRFMVNWEESGGRLQTALFATGFVLLNENLQPFSILDYGCGCGDSLPVFKMKYPEAELFFYDISQIAMKRANRYYHRIATEWNSTGDRRFDLVYCSNVVEHVEDFSAFCDKLCALSKKYIVIQAPFDQRHPDGAPLTHDSRMEDHIRTITADMANSLPDKFRWETRFCRIPVAWDHGEQIFFVGTRNDA